jgi:D-xylonolactonase
MLLYDTRCRLGEGVLVSPLDGSVYWVDIERGQVFRDGSVIREGPVVGGFTLQADGSLLLFGAEGRVSRWQHGHESVLVESLPELAGSRFNDVIATPDGRVVAGSLNGFLFQVSHDGSCRRVGEGYGQPNGMAFTPLGLYFTDTHAATVYLFDDDLSQRRVAFRTDGEPGFADGLVADVEGFLWSARWGGSCLIRYAPDGRVDRKVELPVENVTSASFCGEDLYVSTASEDRLPPPAGGLFRLAVGVGGVPEFMSSVCLAN